MQNKCFREVEDFQELVESGDLQICFLHDPEMGYKDNRPKNPEGLTQKLIQETIGNFLFENGIDSLDELDITEEDFIRSINGKFNYRSAEEANLPRNINRNLGISYPREIEKDTFWVCIDIDGQDSTYMTESDLNLKLATRYYLFKCLEHGLNERGIKFLCASTANQGFHIYFKAKKTNYQSHGFDIFSYPNSMELIEKIVPNVLSDHPILNAVIGKPLNKKAIEVFTNKSYTVAPGSVIDGKKYALLPNGVQRFKDVSVYEDGYVEKLIRDILSEDCYLTRDFAKEKEMSTLQQSTGDKPSSNGIQVLSQNNIRNIGDLIIKSFPHIPNMKHQATLALGGFLYHNNIDKKSIENLGNYIIDNAPDDLFRQSKEAERSGGFMQTLVHDASEGDPDKKKTGLTTLKELFQGTPVPMREFLNILWLNACPIYHKFTPNGIDTQTYQEVKIDFQKNETSVSTFKNGTDDEGNPVRVKLSSQVIKHVLMDFSYIDDISSPYVEFQEKGPITFYTQSNVMENRQYFFNSTDELLEMYRTIPLAHARGSTEILSLVLNEYENIGLIGTKEGSQRPGIYFSRDFKQLKKFVEIDGKVVEVEPTLPSKSDLSNALILLHKINDTYPWYEDKFATFVKLGMILPYGYVFKTRYRSHIRGIILYGEAGTCKSSASELLVHMNVPHKSIMQKEADYLVPGSEFATVYRMGKVLSAHSYPIAIEEVENVFEKSENRDLIKNSITRSFIRNPGGEEEYYARALPIFSANELTDEIEKSGMFRRFLVLNFVEGERGDKEEVEKALDFLNKDGVRNSRFSELYPIGEFVFYTLSKHFEYFAKNPEKLANAIIEDMQEYSGIDLSWLLETRLEKYYQSDRSSETQTDLSTVLGTLKYHFNNGIKVGGIGSNADERFLEQLIEDKYSYMHRINNKQNNGVLITQDFNKSYKKIYPDAKKISLDRLAELLNDNLDLNKKVIKARMTPFGFKKRIRGIFIDWEDFCSIFNVRPNMEEI